MPAVRIALRTALPCGCRDVEDDDVAWLEGGNENSFDIDEERLAVDRSIEQPGSIDTVMAQRGQESARIPVTMRDLIDEPLAASRPAMTARHVGLGPGFIDEDHRAGSVRP